MTNMGEISTFYSFARSITYDRPTYQEKMNSYENGEKDWSKIAKSISLYLTNPLNAFFEHESAKDHLENCATHLIFFYNRLQTLNDYLWIRESILTCKCIVALCKFKDSPYRKQVCKILEITSPERKLEVIDFFRRIEKTPQEFINLILNTPEQEIESMIDALMRMIQGFPIPVYRLRIIYDLLLEVHENERFYLSAWLPIALTELDQKYKTETGDNYLNDMLLAFRTLPKENLENRNGLIESARKLRRFISHETYFPLLIKVLGIIDAPLRPTIVTFALSLVKIRRVENSEILEFLETLKDEEDPKKLIRYFTPALNQSIAVEMKDVTSLINSYLQRKRENECKLVYTVLENLAKCQTHDDWLVCVRMIGGHYDMATIDFLKKYASDKLLLVMLTDAPTPFVNVFLRSGIEFQNKTHFYRKALSQCLSGAKNQYVTYLLDLGFPVNNVSKEVPNGAYAILNLREELPIAIRQQILWKDNGFAYEMLMIKLIAHLFSLAGRGKVHNIPFNYECHNFVCFFAHLKLLSHQVIADFNQVSTLNTLWNSLKYSTQQHLKKKKNLWSFVRSLGQILENTSPSGSIIVGQSLMDRKVPTIVIKWTSHHIIAITVFRDLISRSNKGLGSESAICGVVTTPIKNFARVGYTHVARVLTNPKISFNIFYEKIETALDMTKKQVHSQHSQRVKNCCKASFFSAIYAAFYQLALKQKINLDASENLADILTKYVLRRFRHVALKEYIEKHPYGSEKIEADSFLLESLLYNTQKMHPETSDMFLDWVRSRNII